MQADVPDSQVLVVARDAAESARLAEGLRAHGLGVLVAGSADEACDHVRRGGVGALVCDPVVEGPEGTPLVDYLVFELGAAPPVVSSALDVAAVAERVRALGGRFRELAPDGPASRRSVRPPSSAGLVELAPGRLADLLASLTGAGESALVEIVTPEALGHVAVEAGELVDCALGPATGAKALARALGATQGTARAGELRAGVLRALDRPAKDLLAEAAARAKEAARLAHVRSDLAGLLHVRDGATPGDDATTARVADRLELPTTLARLLDDVDAHDDDVLAAALALHGGGRLVRVDAEGGQAALGSSRDPFEVRALVARGRRPGYGDAARLVIAASTARLAVLAHTTLGLADVEPSDEPAPPVPLPSVVARVRFGEGIDLDVVALPLVPAYAPLWSAALLGSFLAVRVDGLGGAAFEDACAVARVPCVEVAELVPSLDEASPASVAELLRAAIARQVD